MRKICIITGSRAEWGLLSRLADGIRQSNQAVLQIIATNMHLSAKYGRTVDEIRSGGFVVDAEVPMIDDGAPATSGETVSAMAREMSGFASVFEQLKPDMVVILGDRYEMLVAASAALIFGIPIAHLHGGEITEGAFDDSIRHAITKLSTLHFASTDDYRNRIIQMGEHPDRVFCVGAIGCENIKEIARMSLAELEKSLDFSLSDKYFLVTYHPVTVGPDTGAQKIGELLAALDAFPDYKVLVTSPNSDKGGDDIRKGFERYESERKERVKLVTSLGMKRYLSALSHASAVVGNSSSGLIEAPSFGIPTVNIGPRQNGRTRAESVIDCDENRASIADAISKAVSLEFVEACKTVNNPYEKSGTVGSILKELLSCELNKLAAKRFYDLPGDCHV